MDCSDDFAKLETIIYHDEFIIPVSHGAAAAGDWITSHKSYSRPPASQL